MWELNALSLKILVSIYFILFYFYRVFNDSKLPMNKGRLVSVLFANKRTSIFSLSINGTFWRLLSFKPLKKKRTDISFKKKKNPVQFYLFYNSLRFVRFSRLESISSLFPLSSKVSSVLISAKFSGMSFILLFRMDLNK